MNEAIATVGSNALVLDSPEDALNKEASLIEQKASSVAVTNDAEYAAAGELTKAVKQMQKKVKEYWEPLRVNAKAAYDEVLSHKKEMLDPLEAAEKILKGEQLGVGLLRCGLVVGIPIHVGKAPEHCLVAQFLSQFQVLLTVFPLRGPVEVGQFLPGDLLIQRRQRIQLLLEAGLVGNGGHIRVVVGVVAYDVSLRRHPADDVRGRFDHVAHHEEGRRSAVLFQRV